jgi:hypothetical protein
VILKEETAYILLSGSGSGVRISLEDPDLGPQSPETENDLKQLFCNYNLILFMSVTEWLPTKG